MADGNAGIQIMHDLPRPTALCYHGLDKNDHSLVVVLVLAVKEVPPFKQHHSLLPAGCIVAPCGVEAKAEHPPPTLRMRVQVDLLAKAPELPLCFAEGASRLDSLSQPRV